MTSPQQETPQQETGAAEPKKGVLRRMGTWWFTTLAAGIAALVASVIGGGWAWVSDTANDVAGQPPLRVVVDEPFWGNDLVALPGVLKRGPDHALLLRGPSPAEMDGLLQRQQAHRVKEVEVTVVVQGLRSKPVRIIDVRPHVITSSPIVRGTCLRTLPPQGEPNHFLVKANLDDFHPPAGRSLFLKNSVDLRQDERLTVELTVSATRRAHDWEIEVLFDYGADSGLQRIRARPNGGRPLRITGMAKTYDVSYVPANLYSSYRKADGKRTCAL
ncbi:hypothetical protein [Herbidospora sp. RD11066]